MKHRRIFSTFVALALVALLSACAQKRLVIARRNPACTPSLTAPISLADPNITKPELLALKNSVNAELARRGVKTVSARQSDFSLGYWIDESWENSKSGEPDMAGAYAQHTLQMTRAHQAQNYRVYPGVGTVIQPEQPVPPVVYRPNTRPANEGYTQSIHLRLFVSHPREQNRLETAWEGYILGGARLSPKEYDPLLKALFDYFGKDFTGKVPIR